MDKPISRDSQHYVFYTDGTCDLPKNQNCCRAAWAVVQHVRTNSEDPSLNDFAVVQTSHTTSFQTINRAELESVTWLVGHFDHYGHDLMSIHTDSNFVINILDAILQMEH